MKTTLAATLLATILAAHGCGGVGWPTQYTVVTFRVVDVETGEVVPSARVKFAAVQTLEGVDPAELIDGCGDTMIESDEPGEYLVAIRTIYPTLFAPEAPRIIQPYWVIRVSSEGREDVLTIDMFENGTAEGHRTGLPRFLNTPVPEGEYFLVDLIDSGLNMGGEGGSIPDGFPGSSNCDSE